MIHVFRLATAPLVLLSPVVQPFWPIGPRGTIASALFQDLDMEVGAVPIRARPPRATPRRLSGLGKRACKHPS